MDNNDAIVKPGVSLHGRREVLRMAAAGTAKIAGALALAGMGMKQEARAWTPGPNTVVLTPEETEGPYFVDERLNRSDVRSEPSDKSIQIGHPLELNIKVARLKKDKDAVSPVVGAFVDIWHCNALGVYSDVPQQRTGGKKFLRGYQKTDAEGAVKFMTVYPGWYGGRAVHIHFKVRLFTADKTTYEFTSQFYFDDNITDKVHARAPYSQRGSRDIRNDDDGIFLSGSDDGSDDGSVAGRNGSLLLLKLTEDSRHAVGTFNVVLDTTKTGRQERQGRGGPGRGRGPGRFGPPPDGLGPDGPE